MNSREEAEVSCEQCDIETVCSCEHSTVGKHNEGRPSQSKEVETVAKPEAQEVSIDQDETVRLDRHHSFLTNSESFQRKHEGLNFKDALPSGKNGAGPVGQNPMCAHVSVAEDQSSFDRLSENSPQNASDCIGPNAQCRHLLPEPSLVHTTESCTEPAKDQTENTKMSSPGKGKICPNDETCLLSTSKGLLSSFNYGKSLNACSFVLANDEKADGTGVSYSGGLSDACRQQEKETHALSGRTPCLDCESNCDGAAVGQPVNGCTAPISPRSPPTHNKTLEFCNTNASYCLGQYDLHPYRSSPGFVASTLNSGREEVEDIEIDESDGPGIVHSSASCKDISCKDENPNCSFGGDGSSTTKSLHQPANNGLKMEPPTVPLEVDCPETQARDNCPDTTKSCEGCPSFPEVISIGDDALLKVKQNTEICAVELASDLETRDMDIQTTACTEGQYSFLSTGSCDGCHLQESLSDCKLPSLVAHRVGGDSGTEEHSMDYTKEEMNSLVPAELKQKGSTEQCTSDINCSPVGNALCSQHVTLQADQPVCVGDETKRSINKEKEGASVNTECLERCTKSFCSSGIDPSEEKPHSEPLLGSSLSLQMEQNFVCDYDVAWQKTDIKMVIVDKSRTESDSVESRCDGMYERNMDCADTAKCEGANVRIWQQTFLTGDVNSQTNSIIEGEGEMTSQDVVLGRSPGGDLLSTDMKQEEAQKPCSFDFQSTNNHIMLHNSVVAESLPKVKPEDMETDRQGGVIQSLTENNNTSEMAGKLLLLHAEAQSRGVTANNPTHTIDKLGHSIDEQCKGTDHISSQLNIRLGTFSGAQVCKMEDNKDVQKTVLSNIPSKEGCTSNAHQCEEKSDFFASDTENISLITGQQLNSSTEEQPPNVKMKSVFRVLKDDAVLCGTTGQGLEDGDFPLESGTDMALHSRHQTEEHHVDLTAVPESAAPHVNTHQCDSSCVFPLESKECFSYPLPLHTESLPGSLLGLQKVICIEKVHAVETSLGNRNQGGRTSEYFYNSQCIDANISLYVNKQPGSTSLQMSEKAAGMEYRKSDKAYQTTEVPDVSGKAEVHGLSESDSFVECSMPNINEQCAQCVSEVKKMEAQMQKVGLQSMMCPHVVDGSLLGIKATSDITSMHSCHQLQNSSEKDIHATNASEDEVDAVYIIPKSHDAGVGPCNIGQSDSLTSENCNCLANHLLDAEQQNLKLKATVQNVSELAKNAASMDNDQQVKLVAKAADLSDRSVSLQINHQPAEGDSETEAKSTCAVLSEAVYQNTQIPEVQTVCSDGPSNAKQCQEKTETLSPHGSGRYSFAEWVVQPDSPGCKPEQVTPMVVDNDCQSTVEQVLPSKDVYASNSSHSEESPSILPEHFKFTDCTDSLQTDQFSSNVLKTEFEERETNHVVTVIAELGVQGSLSVSTITSDCEATAGCSSLKLPLNSALKGEDATTVKERDLHDADSSDMQKGYFPVNCNCIQKAGFCTVNDYPLDSFSVPDGQHSVETRVDEGKSDVNIAPGPKVRPKDVCSNKITHQELNIEYSSKDCGTVVCIASLKTLQAVCQLHRESSSVFPEGQTVEGGHAGSQHCGRDLKGDDQSSCLSNPNDVCPSNIIHTKGEFKSLQSSVQMDYEGSQLHEQKMVTSPGSKKELLVTEVCNVNSQKASCEEKVCFNRVEISTQNYPHYKTAVLCDQQVVHSSKIQKQIEMETDRSAVEGEITSGVLKQGSDITSGVLKQERSLISASQCGVEEKCYSDESKCSESLMDTETDADLPSLEAHLGNICNSDAGQTEQKRSPLCTNHHSASGDVKTVQTHTQINQVSFKDSVLPEAEGSSVYPISILQYKGRLDCSGDSSNCQDFLVSFLVNEMTADSCLKHEPEMKLKEKPVSCHIPLDTSKCEDVAGCPFAVESRCQDHSTLLTNWRLDSGSENLKELSVCLTEEKVFESTKPKEVSGRHLYFCSPSQVNKVECLVIGETNPSTAQQIKEQAGCSLGIAKKGTETELHKAELQNLVVPDLCIEKVSFSHGTFSKMPADLPLGKVEGCSISLAKTTFCSEMQENTANVDKACMESACICDKYDQSVHLSAPENGVHNIHSNLKSSGPSTLNTTLYEGFEDQKSFKLGILATNEFGVDSVAMSETVGKMEPSHKENIRESYDSFTVPLEECTELKPVNERQSTLSSCVVVKDTTLVETAFQGPLTIAKVPEENRGLDMFLLCDSIKVTAAEQLASKSSLHLQLKKAEAESSFEKELRGPSSTGLISGMGVCCTESLRREAVEVAECETEQRENFLVVFPTISATPERRIADDEKTGRESNPLLAEKHHLASKLVTKKNLENVRRTDSQSGIASYISNDSESARPLYSDAMYGHSAVRKKMRHSGDILNADRYPGDEVSCAKPLQVFESIECGAVNASNNKMDATAPPSAQEASRYCQQQMSVVAPPHSKVDCRRPFRSTLENKASLSEGIRFKTVIPDSLKDSPASVQGQCVETSMHVRHRCSEDLVDTENNVKNCVGCEAMLLHSEDDRGHCAKTEACVDQEGQGVTLIPKCCIFSCTPQKAFKESMFKGSRTEGAYSSLNDFTISSISENAEANMINPSSVEDSKCSSGKDTLCTLQKQEKPKIFRRRSKTRRSVIISGNSHLSVSMGSSFELLAPAEEETGVSLDPQHSELQLNCINSAGNTACAFNIGHSLVSLPSRVQPSRRCKKTPVFETPQRLKKLKCRNSDVFVESCSVSLSLEKQLLKSESLSHLEGVVTYDMPVVAEPIPVAPAAKQAEVNLASCSGLWKSTKEPLLLRRLSVVARRLASSINVKHGCPLNRSAEMKLAAPKIRNRFRSKLMDFFPSVNGWSKLHRNCFQETFRTNFQSPKREHFTRTFARTSTSGPVVHIQEHKYQTFTTPKFPACVLVKFKYLPVPGCNGVLQHCETSDKLTLQAASVKAGSSNWTFSVFLPQSSLDVDQHNNFFLNKLQFCPESLKSLETVCSSQLSKDSSRKSISRSLSSLGLNTVLALSSPGCYRLWTRRRNVPSNIPAIQKLFLEQFIGVKGLSCQSFLAERLFTSLPFSLARIMSIWSQHGPPVFSADFGEVQLKSIGWFPALDTCHSPSSQLTCSGIPEPCPVLSEVPVCVTEPSSTELPGCSLPVLNVSRILHSEAPVTVEVKEEHALDEDKVKKTTKKVSQIKIRKAVPKPDPNLTPMGLPKPKRVTKKEFSLEEIYTNKNYKGPPANRCLETIFEEPKEKNGSLICISHQKRKRVLDFQDFTVPRKRRARSGVKMTIGRTRGQKQVQDNVGMDILLIQKLTDLENFFADEEAG
ncbi:protein PRR14L [Protopterus annectens]|uniref:protein PRR14L n=1 Tax=Protopterus annectens TaxID=7888 RepID=UPI001CF94983|nr:protein PRR14L [Protopterus annectens]